VAYTFLLAPGFSYFPFGFEVPLASYDANARSDPY
jgi:hypothetical protein